MLGQGSPLPILTYSGKPAGGAAGAGGAGAGGAAGGALPMKLAGGAGGGALKLAGGSGGGALKLALSCWRLERSSGVGGNGIRCSRVCCRAENWSLRVPAGRCTRVPSAAESAAMLPWQMHQGAVCCRLMPCEALQAAAAESAAESAAVAAAPGRSETLSSAAESAAVAATSRALQAAAAESAAESAAVATALGAAPGTVADTLHRCPWKVALISLFGNFTSEALLQVLKQDLDRSRRHARCLSGSRAKAMHHEIMTCANNGYLVA